MNVTHRACDDFGDSRGCPRRQALGDAIGQRPTRHVFQDQKETIIGLAHLIKGHHMRVSDLRRGMSLSQPMIPLSRSRPLAPRQNLDRNLPPWQVASGQIDHPRRTFTQLLLDGETGELQPSLSHGRRCREARAFLRVALEGSMTFRAPFDMLLDGGIGRIAEGVGAKRAKDFFVGTVRHR